MKSCTTLKDHIDAMDTIHGIVRNYTDWYKVQIGRKCNENILFNNHYFHKCLIRRRPRLEKNVIISNLIQ